LCKNKIDLSKERTKKKHDESGQGFEHKIEITGSLSAERTVIIMEVKK